MRLAILTLFVTIFVLEVIAVAEDLNCLTEKERSNASLYSHLQQQAYAALDQRDKAYEQLKTPD